MPEMYGDGYFYDPDYDPNWFYVMNPAEPDNTYFVYEEQPLIFLDDDTRGDLEESGGYRLPRESLPSKLAQAALASPQTAIGTGIIILLFIVGLRKVV